MKNQVGLFDPKTFVIEAAIEHLLTRIDVSEFYRSSVLEELKRQREIPCPAWIQSFHAQNDLYSLDFIEDAYREACCELIEYFSED